MPQNPPWWWQQQWQATNPGLPTPTGAGPGGPETGGASYQNVGGSPSYDPYSSGPPSSTGGVDLPQINDLYNPDLTSAPFGSPGQGGPGSYPSSTPYPDPITYGQYMGPHYQVQGVNFQDPMTDYAPPPADIYGPPTDTNNYSPAGDGGQYVYDENWNYLSYEPPPDQAPSTSASGGDGGYQYDPTLPDVGGELPSTTAFAGDQGTGTISGLPGGDVPLLDTQFQDTGAPDNAPTSTPLELVNALGYDPSQIQDFSSDAMISPSVASPFSDARLLPGATTDLGSFSGGQLPGYGYDIGGLHKPFTPEQYSNLPSQFQSPFTAGMQMPSYSQYLAAWNPPTNNAQPGDEQPGDTGFPTGLVHSGQHIAPR